MVHSPSATSPPRIDESSWTSQPRRLPRPPASLAQGSWWNAAASQVQPPVLSTKRVSSRCTYSLLRAHHSSSNIHGGWQKQMNPSIHARHSDSTLPPCDLAMVGVSAAKITHTSVQRYQFTTNIILKNVPSLWFCSAQKGKGSIPGADRIPRRFSAAHENRTR